MCDEERKDKEANAESFCKAGSLDEGNGSEEIWYSQRRHIQGMEAEKNEVIVSGR